MTKPSGDLVAVEFLANRQDRKLALFLTQLAPNGEKIHITHPYLNPPFVDREKVEAALLPWGIRLEFHPTLR